MSRSSESRPRGSPKEKTKITYAARARTLTRLKKNYHVAQGFAFLAHSLLRVPKGSSAQSSSRVPRLNIPLFIELNN